LENAIDQAKIGYEDALKQFNKLSVRSPIAGVIDMMMVDEGQEVGPGAQLFTMVSNKDQEVEIYVTSQEFEYLDMNQVVVIRYGEDLLQ